jgi:UPF0176 protein
MTPEPRYAVVALYKFAKMSAAEIHERQATLRALGEANDVVGILLLAEEGINGTIAGSRQALDLMVGEIGQWPGFHGASVKWSAAETRPFTRLKVRVKREIVTMGRPDADPNVAVGTYVAPEDWNAVISRPDMVVIDTRNDYEVGIGTFEGAVNPQTKHFREFPEWVAAQDSLAKKPPVAMFCTGGIRCEKATAFMKQQGFDEVYHLDGGILRYLETVPKDESLWNGECFVFDRRVSVGHGLEPGPYKLCSICRTPFVPGDVSDANDHQGGYAGTDCPACEAEASERAKARAAERRRQLALRKARA